MKHHVQSRSAEDASGETAFSASEQRDEKHSRKTNSEIRIGISGWTYRPWTGGAFYPKGWPQQRELEYASRQVNSIEINGTFYALQTPESYHAWYKATPEGFVFSLKAGRFITHLKRLVDITTPLANFFASGLLRLKEKLGPILWQLPPSFRYNKERLEEFFRLLPRDTKEASALAKKHDEHLKARPWTRTEEALPLRHALEVRHDSFKTPEFIELLHGHDIGLVVADTAGKWPFMEDTTSDFVYVRLHGDEELYASGYTDTALKGWAKKARTWADGNQPGDAKLLAAPAKARKEGRDVFVYFDNDVKVRAPYDAMSLSHRLGLRGAPPEAPNPEDTSEAPRTHWASSASRKSE
jgi:uncharacterized protein YecE (DUF72 family)